MPPGCGKSGGVTADQQEPPRLILLDLLMPEMDGFQLFEQIQASESLRHIPIIVVTAKELTASERDTLRGKVSTILQKSAYNLDQLTDVVRKFASRQSR